MKTLYIIGNGFDSANDMPTSYGHFCKWLRDSKDENARRLHWALSHFADYSNVGDIWSSVEEGLGEVDIKAYLEDIKSEHIGQGETIVDNYGKVQAALNAWHDIDKEDVLEKISDYFADWIHSIQVAKEVDSELAQWLDPNGLFLSFNYTATLEDLYGINSQNILHIHGFAKDKKSRLMFGHGTQYDLKECEKIGDEVLGFDADGIAKSYGRELNKLYKDTKSILGVNQEWFENLSNAGIDKIYCYGLSLGTVDDMYFREITKRLPNAQWTFYIYKGKDYIEFEKNRTNVLCFICRMQIDKNKCKAYDSFFLDHEISLRR